MLDRKGRLTMDEPKKRLLNSLRTEPGVFSEVYISSPVGEGVARNILDPATPPAVLQQAGGQRADRRTARAGPVASTRPSPNCCGDRGHAA
ncbi:MAG: hypothetical protein MZW92_45045 [Comamonadaceae bacterium]|nr:hypothetical protein [Comamonadaceae bacterium]